MDFLLTLPRTVREYACALAIDFDAAVVWCKFCGNSLNYCDLSNFDEKRLCLIWRNLKVYGVCSSCLKDSAKLESEWFYQRSEVAAELHRQGKLVGLKTRCVHCYRLLSYAEKLCLVAEHRLVHYVRGGWRALCKFCKPK
ncbi:E6 [Rangifer tarandus papillomavirus 2]|uniref:Protein E6 n=1 Tax=Rangifer tarandus papillomavirus 2 TaxID=1370094 RepID=S5RRZ1_9PAPI|nr:E6 [Rangifer tarandus papillomavirus 2]AGS08604.1 E6 [Rangifer tarandus papillomavirus 2]